MKEEMKLVFSAENEVMASQMKGYMAEMEKDTEVMEAVGRATTLDEFYDAAHAYIKTTFEDFKAAVEALTDKVEAAFNEALQGGDELNEAQLDVVVGGGIGSWFKKNWKKVALTACGVLAVAGAALVTGGAGVAALAAATKVAMIKAGTCMAVGGILGDTALSVI